MSKRVVVTGMGCVSSLGVGVHTNWQSLIAGKSGISKFSIPTTTAVNFGGSIGSLPAIRLDVAKVNRFISRPVHMALIAAQEAIEDAGLLSAYDKSSIGISVGTGMVHLPDVIENLEAFKDFGSRKISPFFIPRILPNTPAGLIAILFGLQGPVQCISTGCATGAASIGEAFLWIRQGLAECMVAGATESALDAMSLAGFCQAKAMITDADVEHEFHGDIGKASRPFDRKRNGFVMGEGAAIVTLENLEQARKRNANIYAELVGYGNTCDGYHVTAPAPDGNGAYRAMKNALLHCNELPDYINAHATSTKLGDSAELLAIGHLCSGRNVHVSASKSSVGHLLGASGALEFVHTIKAVQTGIVPPTLNFEKYDKPCTAIISNKSKNSVAIAVALCNSFGFSGNNVSLAIRKFS